jgi:hypothetical protein
MCHVFWYHISFFFVLLPCLSRQCLTGFIPEAVLKRSRDKFLNFPTRSQRKSYITNLRTPKSRYGTPLLVSVCCIFIPSNLWHSLLYLCYTMFSTNKKKQGNQTTICHKHSLTQTHFVFWWSFCLCRSGLALGSGLFPICQKGAKELFGVGCGLLHSVLETPKAPTHPHPFRVGVPGISTARNQNPQTSPLISKGDIVER